MSDEQQVQNDLAELVGTATALLLVLLAVSGVVMWWRRRRVGLGAPTALPRPAFGAGLVIAIVALALYLPMFGITLIAVLAAEATVRRSMPDAARWLGLRSPIHPGSV